MNGVLGLAELLMDTDLDDAQREQLTLLRDCAQSLLQIINDILDFSKIEAGKLDITPELFDPRELLQSTVRPFCHRANTKGLRLAVVETEHLPPALLGDPGRIRQILVNLIGNAVKFTDAGEVRISGRTFPDAEGSTRLMLEVCDTGPGIPPTKQEAIFDAFEQGDSTVTRRHGGTGLGLAIVSKLVKLMDGRIDLDSRPGHGATFRIILPLRAPTPGTSLPEPAPRVADTPTTRGPLDRSLHVLLAEDNLVNQKLAVAFLTRLGLTVETVCTGRQAVRAATGGGFDLILMDIQMPEMDGLEATRRIRDMEGDQQHTPIVAMTAHALASDRQNCLVAGMDGYVSKPVSLDSLRSEIQRICASGVDAAD